MHQLNFVGVTIGSLKTNVGALLTRASTSTGTGSGRDMSASSQRRD
jgi:hypothetical protein